MATNDATARFPEATAHTDEPRDDPVAVHVEDGVVPEGDRGVGRVDRAVEVGHEYPRLAVRHRLAARGDVEGVGGRKCEEHSGDPERDTRHDLVSFPVRTGNRSYARGPAAVNDNWVAMLAEGGAALAAVPAVRSDGDTGHLRRLIRRHSWPVGYLLRECGAHANGVPGDTSGGNRQCHRRRYARDPDGNGDQRPVTRCAAGKQDAEPDDTLHATLFSLSAMSNGFLRRRGTTRASRRASDRRATRHGGCRIEALRDREALRFRETRDGGCVVHLGLSRRDRRTAWHHCAPRPRSSTSLPNTFPYPPGAACGAGARTASSDRVGSMCASAGVAASSRTVASPSRRPPSRWHRSMTASAAHPLAYQQEVFATHPSARWWHRGRATRRRATFRMHEAPRRHRGAHCGLVGLRE